MPHAVRRPSRLVPLLLALAALAAPSPLAAAPAPAPAAGPSRIVVFFPQAVGLVSLFDLRERIVGWPLAKLQVADRPGGFYATLDPGMKAKADVGFPGQPNVEAIAALKPDLIVEPEFKLKIEPFLEKLGVPRFKVGGTFADAADWLAAVDAFGARVGKPEVSAKYRAWFEASYALVAKRLAGLKDPAPRVAHIQRVGDRFITHGQKSGFAKALLRAAGAKPYGDGIVDAPEYDLNREELLKFDPDWIVLEEITHATSRKTIELSEPYWKTLRAVREGHVLHVPVDDPTCFLTGWFFNTAAPLGLLWVAKALHPDRFRDLDPDVEAARFYKEFYGIDLAALRKAGPAE